MCHWGFGTRASFSKLPVCSPDSLLNKFLRVLSSEVPKPGAAPGASLLPPGPQRALLKTLTF